MFLNYILLSIAISGLTFIARNKILLWILVLLFMVLQIAMGFFVAEHLGERVLGFFYLDEVGMLFFLILILLSAAAFFHSYFFLKRNSLSKKHESQYFSALMLLLLAMSCAYFADDLAIYWILAEMTTLFVAILILFKKNIFSLEAGWKYLFVASVGLTIAFAGILLFNSLISGNSLSATTINLQTVNSTWLKIAFLLILTGLSVKIESFPFFPVCVDALGIAPPPVSALMTTCLMNMGLIAIIRTYIVTMPSEIFPWIKSVLLIMGLLSLVFAAYRIFKAKYLERILGFSSLEHIGIILIALSFGQAGFYAALLHIVFHSLIKSSLFFQADQISHIFHTHKLKKIGNYFKYSPIGALVFFLGFLGITAIPPSGLFISEFLIVNQFIIGKRYILCVVVLLLLLIIIYSLGKNMLRLLFFDENEDSEKEQIPLNRMETMVPLALLVFMIYLAYFQPPFLMKLIEKTTLNY